MDLKIAEVRTDYKKSKLSKKDVLQDPLKQFEKWLDEAIKSQVYEPTAMIISTVSEEGRPSSRTVLLKDIKEGVLIFYTNYNSRKAENLANNPYISATFFWKELERQVHIEGATHKTDASTSDEYFKTRPWKSRIGARISPQSSPINSRDDIKIAFAKEAAKFVGKTIPRPNNWGGYAIVPDRFEFWQGRPNRLHDRIQFIKDPSQNIWKIERLAP